MRATITVDLTKEHFKAGGKSVPLSELFAAYAKEHGMSTDDAARALLLRGIRAAAATARCRRTVARWAGVSSAGRPAPYRPKT